MYLIYISFFFVLFSLCAVHHFKSIYTRRLINARIENIPLTEEIFKPNEQIINNSLHSKNCIKS
jgi:hypothetical protein